MSVDVILGVVRDALPRAFRNPSRHVGTEIRLERSFQRVQYNLVTACSRWPLIFIAPFRYSVVFVVVFVFGAPFLHVTL